MRNKVKAIQINGKWYVVLPRDEYDRLKLLANVNSVTRFPELEKRRRHHAAKISRVNLARKMIRNRTVLGLTQMELAELSGLCRETINRIESTKFLPSPATMDRIKHGFQRAERAKSHERNASAKRR